MRHLTLLVPSMLVAACASHPVDSNQLALRIELRGAPVVGAAFSADGRLLVTASTHREFVVRDGRTGASTSRFETLRVSAGKPLEIEVDSERGLIAVKSEGTWVVFDAKTGATRSRDVEAAHAGWQAADSSARVTSELAERAQSACGGTARVAAATSDRAVTIDDAGRARFWTFDASGVDSIALDDHGDVPTGLALSHDGRWLWLQSASTAAEVHSLEDTTVTRSPTSGSLLGAGEGATFVVAEFEHVYVYDAERDVVVREIRIADSDAEPVRAPIELTHDGRWLEFRRGRDTHLVRVSDDHHVVLRGVEAECLTPSPDGSRFVVGTILGEGHSARPVLSTYSSDDGARIGEPIVLPFWNAPAWPSVMLTIELCPDSRHLLFGNFAQRALIDMATGEVVASRGGGALLLRPVRMDRVVGMDASGRIEQLELPSLETIGLPLPERALAFAIAANTTRVVIATLGAVSVFDIR